MKKTIKMTETQKGSPNGREVHTYQKGEVYEIEESLAEVFLKNGWAQNFDKQIPNKVEMKGEFKVEDKEEGKARKKATKKSKK